LRFVDANIFLRYLTWDDPEKSPACQAVFDALDANVEDGFSSESIVAEVLYVMTSSRQYGLDRVDVAERLRPALSTRGLHFPAKAIVLRALDLYQENAFLDFEDALTAAHMESTGISELYSYDRDFDRVPGVSRLEP
jgi:uncharacterized protein